MGKVGEKMLPFLIVLVPSLEEDAEGTMLGQCHPLLAYKKATLPCKDLVY